MHTDQSYSSGSSAAEGVAPDAHAKVAEVTEQAQEKAQHVAGKAQDKLREQLDERSSQAGAQIAEQASDLRQVGESLREQGKEGPAKAADQLARYVEKVGSYLREKDSHALLSDAEDFGRRRPWATAAGGLAAGLAASRFLKASSAQRYRERTTVPRPNGVYATPARDAENGSAQAPVPSEGRTTGPVM